MSPTSERIQKYIETANMSDPQTAHVSHSVLGQDALIGRIRHKKEANSRLFLSQANDRRRNAALSHQVELFHRMMAVVCEHGVSAPAQVQRVIQVALSHHRSPGYIIEQLQRAVHRYYSAKSYTDKEKDIALLVLRIGGPRLLEILNHERILPSRWAVSASSFSSSPIFDLTSSLTEFVYNAVLMALKSIYTSAASAATGRLSVACSLMVDDIALVPRARYHAPTDSIIGLCYQHVPEKNPSALCPIWKP